MPASSTASRSAKRALIAQQAVLKTVGHNLANAATPGYTRQRAELSPVTAQNGVEVTASFAGSATGISISR